MDINKVVVIGHLVKDAELKFTQGKGTAVTTFRLAVNRMPRDGEKKADYFNIVLWGKLGENIIDYLVKGKFVAIVGRLQNNNYETDKAKYYTSEIIASEIQLLSKNEGVNRAAGAGGDFTPIDEGEDGDIPF